MRPHDAAWAEHLAELWLGRLEDVDFRLGLADRGVAASVIRRYIGHERDAAVAREAALRKVALDYFQAYHDEHCSTEGWPHDDCYYETPGLRDLLLPPAVAEPATEKP